MRILHISDLHCGSDAVSNQDQLVGAMLADVRDLHGKVPFNLVVFTGDLAGTGKAEEFDRARTILLDPLIAGLGLPAERIVLAPGNHDIDRTLISDLLEPGLKGIKDSDEVDRLVADPDEFRQATRRVGAWRAFHDEFYPAGAVVDPNPLCWGNHSGPPGARGRCSRTGRVTSGFAK